MAQETLKKLSEAWRSYFRLRARWKEGTLKNKPGLPKYRKKKDGTRPSDFIPIKCSRSYSIDARTVSATLPADLRAGSRLILPYRGLRRYVGDMGRAELLFDAGRGRGYFFYAVEVSGNRVRGWQRCAAIDLGVRVLASVSIEGGAKAFHFMGRDVLKDWDYFGRKIAEHMRELSHRPPDNRSSMRLRRLYARRMDRLIHTWETLAARIVSVLKRYRIGKVFIGWPKDILRNTHYGSKWNGRIHGFWSFGKAIRILERHLVRAGIIAERSGERGSSSTCPDCGSRDVVRRPRHVLTCRACGFSIHADQAGSRNILKENIPSANWDREEASLRPETYWWNSHLWADVSNRSARSERLAA